MYDSTVELSWLYRDSNPVLRVYQSETVTTRLCHWRNNWQILVVIHVLFNDELKRSKKNRGLRNPMGTCRTLQWRHVDHVMLNLKMVKKNASPGFEHGYSLVMISDDIHSATQDINLHIITSSEDNDQDLKDAAKLRCCMWGKQTIFQF